MRISARAQRPGRVTEIMPGAVNGLVKVDIGGGMIVTASITEEAISEVGPVASDAVTVFIKASDVPIGK